ncbi:MAG: hypothetical protein RLZZ546_1590 [Bacteroidota bacterium]
MSQFKIQKSQSYILIPSAELIIGKVYSLILDTESQFLTRFNNKFLTIIQSKEFII